MRRSGLTHLLSVSGLHIAAVVAFAMFLSLKLLALSERLALRFNLVLVSWMSRLSYVELVSAGRLSTGLVLAMLFYGWSRRNTTILWACQIYALTFPYYALGILG